MVQTVKIAIIAAPTGLQRQLEELPLQPRVQAFADLYEAATAIGSFSPRLLIFELTASFTEDLGAIRVLRSIVPDLEVLVLGSGPATPDVRELCRARDLRYLTPPFDQAALTQAIEKALRAAPDPERSESYLQFVQGICDEINNPLMFASGHLQILENQLDSQRDRGPIAQIAAIRKGLLRIDQTMRKVNNMARATKGDRRHETFNTSELLAQTEAQLEAAGTPTAIDCSDEVRRIHLHGDLQLLAGALFSLAQVGAELSGDRADQPNPPPLQVIGVHGEIEARLLVENAQLEAWELPRAFEPYHLNHVLRGTTLGLNLFLVRLVCRAHGGDAVARRTAADRVEFHIGLGPSASSITTEPDTPR